HVDRLAEGDLVDAHRHHVGAGVAAGAGIGDLVEQLEDVATVDVAGKVGGVRGHQHRHAELMAGKIHDCSLKLTCADHAAHRGIQFGGIVAHAVLEHDLHVLDVLDAAG